MGHKVSPIANRLGITRTWSSRWFSTRKGFGQLVNEDAKIRLKLEKELASAAVARIDIERTASKVRVIIFSARPGLIIGRRGADIDRLRTELHLLTKREIIIDIKEIQNPAAEAQLVAANIAFQLEKQISFRRAMKRALQLGMTSGALGIKIRCAGRLGGAEMSRVETYREGSIPLGTFRANIDYGFAEAKTTYGRIGVKCWVHKSEPAALSKKPVVHETPAAAKPADAPAEARS